MNPLKILIVEDEALVAADLSRCLTDIGYHAAGSVDTGADAVDQTLALRPNLVLMDIRLKGPLDGIEAARQIRTTVHPPPPVVFLTSHADENTLARAGVTEPFGYLVKPYEARALRAAIEMALYRHETEKKLWQIAHWLTGLLHSIGDPILAVNTEGRVLFLNPAAEVLTGWPLADAWGKSSSEVFHLVNERTREPVENPFKKAFLETVVMRTADDSILIARTGSEAHIDYTALPLHGDSGEVVGAVVAFRNVTQHKLATRGLMELNQQLQSANERFKTLLTLEPLRDISLGDD